METNPITGLIMTIRNHIYALGVLLLGMVSAQPAGAVEFDTGVVRVLLNDYGRVRLALSAPDSSVQIDRLSLLAGVSSTAVFDCIEDAGTVEPAQYVAAPQNSDFELRGAIDNRNSGEPPEVTVYQNLYGWVDAAYALVKFTLINAEGDTLLMRLGSEILPQIGGTYGDESAQWSAETETITIHKNDVYIGIKFLNEPLSSLCFFDWYSGYNASDENLWAWLNYDQFDTLFQAGDDGSVVIPAVDFITLAPGDSTVLWLAIAYGNAQNQMLDNMSAAQDAYNALSVEPDYNVHSVPEFFSLGIYPNPFNPDAVIRFELPRAEEVKLDVFDMQGRRVWIWTGRAALLPAGIHEITFDGSGLTSGIYIVRLRAGDRTAVGRMVSPK